MAIQSAELHTELVHRRDRLQRVVARGKTTPQIETLLRDVDHALDRIDTGTYGRCETCGDPIEADRLNADPLVRFCLDHLSPLEARALEQDLDLAGRVQRTLLPPKRMAVGGWEMAYHYAPFGAVSGDYCDVIASATDEGDLFFLLGDVSGKGVAASMLMAHLHASLRTLVTFGLPLSELLERANRVFCDSTMSNHYATLVCARTMPTGDVEICNAGHCPPLLLQQGKVSRIEATGVPVGLFCVNDYPPRAIWLDSGDALVLYSDGVTETRNEMDDEFGEQRLVELVSSMADQSAESIVSGCVAAVSSFRGIAPRTDDLTVMVVKRS
jgi:phosphoserine phosphatase RsbU/P